MRSLGCAAQYLCPQLPASPHEAIGLVSDIVCKFPVDEVALIGSSLGGYYATYLAERFGCRAVLLNPAVKPPRDLEQYVGVSTAYHSNERFEFKREYISQLQDLSVERITQPERYFLIAASGDEMLDWREMVAHYPGTRQYVIEGSDHGISEFEQYVDEVLAFCGIGSEARQ